MTRPNPLDDADFDTLRKRWLSRYIAVQNRSDKELKDVLIQAAEDAFNLSLTLASKETFSASAKSAQLRILTKELTKILKEVFDEELTIIKDGQSRAAIAAVDAFAETDRRFLSAVFSEAASGTGSSVKAFIAGQKQSASFGVANAISRINKTDRPLSARVYDSRRLANRWVQNTASRLILRNASAKEIATEVRKAIKPNVPGGPAYAAMRLARTEINNAFHATSISLAEDRPWVEGMIWHLSKTHEDTDTQIKEICERYAGTNFAIATVPAKPHPQCRCFVTPALESYETFLNHLTAGQYRDWIKDAA